MSLLLLLLHPAIFQFRRFYGFVNAFAAANSLLITENFSKISLNVRARRCAQKWAQKIKERRKEKSRADAGSMHRQQKRVPPLFHQHRASSRAASAVHTRNLIISAKNAAAAKNKKGPAEYENHAASEVIFERDLRSKESLLILLRRRSNL